MPAIAGLSANRHAMPGDRLLRQTDGVIVGIPQRIAQHANIVSNHFKVEVGSKLQKAIANVFDYGLSSSEFAPRCVQDDIGIETSFQNFSIAGIECHLTRM